MRRHTWFAILVLALALAGAIAFLARQGLERADRYASVAAFLLALLVAGGTIVAALSRRSAPRTDDAGRREPRWSFHPLLAWRTGTIVKGGEGDTHTVINMNHPKRREK
ncbi:hypothetical protein [Plantactinospora sp. GCM10030261]|uniref:hypothetical protein n=1 Tax=Plantactinospora sp. GCM10030261 TaxID=3273420 RepID=UPI003617E05A